MQRSSIRLELEALEDRTMPSIAILSTNPNVNISQFQGNEAETAIAIDPTNPQRLFSAAILHGGQSSLYAATSVNGGVSWDRNVMLTGGPGGDSLPAFAADPQVVYDDFGNLFFAYNVSSRAQIGTATAVGNLTLTDNTRSWAPDMWKGYEINVTIGGNTQTKTIAGNTATQITLEAQWDQMPNQNTPYRIGGLIMPVALISSSDGGQTFTFRGNLGPVVDGGDYPAIAVGPATSDPNGPRVVWAVWRELDAENRRVALYAAWAHVVGKGLIGTFSEPLIVDPGTVGIPYDQEVAIGPNGQVLIAYLRTGATRNDPTQVWLALDPDGTGPLGFQNPLPDPSTYLANTNIRGRRVNMPIPASMDREISADPGIAWDRSGQVNAGPHGVVYVVYAVRGSLEPNDHDTTIVYRSSTDSGLTWTNPVLVHAPNGNSQFMPRIAVDQTTGYAAVAWYDARDDVDDPEDPNDTVNVTARIYANLIGPDRWQPANFEIPVGAGQSSGPASDDWDYGDYIGIAFHDNKIFPAWADNSNSTNDNPDGVLTKMDLYTARVDVSFLNGNNPPVAEPDNHTTAKDTTLNIDVPGILGNDTDAETDPLTALLVNDVSYGILTLNSDGRFIYTPNTGFTGTDSFTYNANDGTSDSNVATVTITVDPTNAPPIAADDYYYTFKDVSLDQSSPGILVNDDDAELDPLTVALVNGPTNGSVTLQGDGSFNYTPNTSTV